MAKEFCTSCDARLSHPVSFCPACSRPTPHASPAELLEWDLAQWRNHVDRSVSVRTRSGSGPAGTVIEVPRAHPAPRLARAAPPLPPAQPSVSVAPKADPRPTAPSPSRKKRPGVRARRQRNAERRLRWMAARRPATEDRVIVLDADNEFVYTACASCERGDWIVRTTRNEDRTFNYWCVRCSRSFKSDARLRHGLKPFLASGSVIGALAMLSIVMR